LLEQLGNGMMRTDTSRRIMINQCGHAKHDMECLCDVKPIGSLWVDRDLVQDMWQGERVTECLGYERGHVWTRDTMLDYLQNLVIAHDLFLGVKPVVVRPRHADYVETICVNTFDEITPVIYYTGKVAHVRNWKMVREIVLAVATQFPTQHLSDILNKLGISVGLFRQSVTSGKNKLVMDETTFRSFCDDMYGVAMTRKWAGVMRKYRNSENSLKYYRRIFGAQRTKVNHSLMPLNAI